MSDRKESIFARARQFDIYLSPSAYVIVAGFLGLTPLLAMYALIFFQRTTEDAITYVVLGIVGITQYIALRKVIHPGSRRRYILTWVLSLIVITVTYHGSSQAVILNERGQSAVVTVIDKETRARSGDQCKMRRADGSLVDGRMACRGLGPGDRATIVEDKFGLAHPAYSVPSLSTTYIVAGASGFVAFLSSILAARSVITRRSARPVLTSAITDTLPPPYPPAPPPLSPK